MPTVVTTITDPEDQRAARRPRTDLLEEREEEPGRFVVTHGPFDHWERTLRTEETAEGTAVVQTVRFRLAIPVWRAMFNPAVAAAIRKPPKPGTVPWWSPPDRIDAPAARSLSLLCVLALVAGYLGTVLTQTNTFAKEEFGVDDAQITTMLAATRVAAVLALVFVALADRRGRRLVLAACGIAGCVATATSALSPDLVALGGTQTLARTFSTALAVVIGIYAVEVMPAGARAFAVSVLGMSGALGAGFCVMALPLADMGPGAWRLLYVLPLLALPGIVAIGRTLPETERFLVSLRRRTNVPPAEDAAPTERTTAAQAAPAQPAQPTPERAEAEQATTPAASPVAHTGSNQRRFVLLAVSALLLALFSSPSSQLLNEYLRTEQGFDATRIALFTILTNTPGGIGVIVGGRLADTRGRRL
ncbi:MAG: MFS transporter, partial [Nitriliruptoraceae bacterium]|nr:MFS transporter [Nitriliruptoraceae bacterium]